MLNILFDLCIVLGWIVIELGDGDVSKMINKFAVKTAKSNANANMAGASFTHARDRKHVWRQLVKCVDVLHGENIVSTDLKPGNFTTFGKKSNWVISVWQSILIKGEFHHDKL